jgi:hypothetical protein
MRYSIHGLLASHRGRARDAFPFCEQHKFGNPRVIEGVHGNEKNQQIARDVNNASCAKEFEN